MTSRSKTWFQVIFNADRYTPAQVKGCLALEIGDLLPNILQLLSDRTQAELCNTENDLAKVDILFKVINSRTGDLELLRSFCRQLARFVGMKHMLRLDPDRADFEELIANELNSPRVASHAEALEKHSDSAPETVLLRDIAFTEELGSGTTFFVYSAKHKGRRVTVKVFNATENARQFVEREIQLANKLIHPNLLRLEGVSAPSSPIQFITYQPGTTGDRHLGTALNLNLETSVALAFQMVGELAAGLNYLHLRGMPIQCIEITQFSVLFDSDQKFLLALNPTALDEAPLSSSPVDINILWQYFNDICGLVFMSANRLIHHDIDDVDRDAERTLLSSPSSHTAGPAQSSEANPGNLNAAQTSDEPASPTIPPRREYAWRKSVRGNQTLSLVAQRLGLIRAGRAAPVRRLHVEPNARTSHRCVGYRREEITIATTSKDSAILSYDSPNAKEICTVCHEEVDAESEDFSPDSDSESEDLYLGYPWRWFPDTFSDDYSHSQIEHALAGSIDDIIQELSDVLTDPTRASLVHASNPLKRVQMLSRYLDTHSRNARLVRAFQRSVSKWCEFEHMLNPRLRLRV